jgi:hypothetical protein
MPYFILFLLYNKFKQISTKSQLPFFQSSVKIITLTHKQTNILAKLYLMKLYRTACPALSGRNFHQQGEEARPRRKAKKEGDAATSPSAKNTA